MRIPWTNFGSEARENLKLHDYCEVLARIWKAQNSPRLNRNPIQSEARERVEDTLLHKFSIVITKRKNKITVKLCDESINKGENSKKSNLKR